MAHATAGGNSAYHNFNNDFAHIADPNERRRLALAEIDKAPFGWYHVRAVVVAGIGFFTDSYDLISINLVVPMLGVVYFLQNGGKVPQEDATWMKTVQSGGTIIGQVGFGILADLVGRKKMYGLELIMILFATLAQALTSASPAVSITGIICFWRVIMGIGVGGDYPLSSIITSEFATTKWRGAMMGSVFAMQGFGQVAAGLVALICVTGFKTSLETAKDYGNCSGGCQAAVDKMWRIVIGFGAVPGCIALYYRLTIPETPRYTFDVAKDVVKAQDDITAYMAGKPEGNPDEITRIQAAKEAEQEMDIPKASWSDFMRHYSKWRYAKVLIGTAGSWFLLDVAYYGLSLNTTLLLESIGYTDTGTQNVYQKFHNSAVGNLIIVCAGAVPGYWFTAFFCDRIGRKPIQIGGFAILTILLAVLGFADKSLGTSGKFALYVIAEFFLNFGPNATTFIIPGECFPTRYRSTSHGISAASGKLGAVIAQVIIGPLATKGALPGAKGPDATPWLPHVLEIFAVFMLLGVFTSLLVPETARKTLEQLAGEVPGTPEYDPDLSGRGRPNNNGTDKLGPEQQV